MGYTCKYGMLRKADPLRLLLWPMGHIRNRELLSSHETTYFRRGHSDRFKVIFIKRK